MNDYYAAINTEMHNRLVEASQTISEVIRRIPSTADYDSLFERALDARQAVWALMDLTLEGKLVDR